MDDKNAPATKADIEALMDSIGKLYDANAQWTEELKGHFDTAVENIRHNLEGAHRDELSVLQDTKRDHEQRITQLEVHAGFRAS